MVIKTCAKNEVGGEGEMVDPVGMGVEVMEEFTLFRVIYVISNKFRVIGKKKYLHPLHPKF